MSRPPNLPADIVKANASPFPYLGKTESWQDQIAFCSFAEQYLFCVGYAHAGHSGGFGNRCAYFRCFKAGLVVQAEALRAKAIADYEANNGPIGSDGLVLLCGVQPVLAQTGVSRVTT